MNKDLRGKTIFITGACSFVGQSLIAYLSKEKLFNQVIACCRNKNKFKKYGSEKITVVSADLTHPASYETFFKEFRPDFVIHLAAVARFHQGEENPELTLKTNFLGSVALLALAEKYDVKKFLNVSSNLARNPKGITGYSKYLTEVYSKRRNFTTKVISLRLPNVIDSPGAVTLVFKRQIEAGEPITITDKRMSRKFITPGQAAAQLLFALSEGENKEIFINNKPSTPIVELAREMIEKSKKNISIRFIGARPGEKMEEEDYPAGAIKTTGHPELFILTEEQHSAPAVEAVLKNMSPGVSEMMMQEINKVLDL